MDKITIQIGGMHCGGCAKRAEQALNQVEGLGKIKVDLKKNCATATCKSVDEQEVKNALEGVGLQLVGLKR